MSNLRQIFALSCILFIFSAARAATETTTPQCVLVNNLNTPERLSGFNGHEGPDTRRLETWCYENRSTDSSKLTLVYKLQDGEIKPELSALVEWDGAKIVSITHGSLYKGEVTFHKMSGYINPLGAPLSLDEAIKNGATLATSLTPASLPAVSKTTFESLLSFSRVHSNVSKAQIDEGVFEEYIPDDKAPWDGYWWNDGGLPLAAGSMSPLGKYDAIIQSWTGTNPQSATWEAQNHSDTSVAWGGHCNGWAASSVLYDEPTKFLWDDKNKVVVLPSDIKGMLAESSFCVNWAFFGNRYWGRQGDELEDIHPDLFHKVLLYYIGTLKKPVAHDYERDADVDNNVIGGYKFTITKIAGQVNQYHVVAVLKRYYYNGRRMENSAKAGHEDVTYAYDLTTDNQGNVTGGKWTGGDNPDFLWVPLSQANGACGWRNANLDPNKIVQIENTLPEAVTKSIPMNFEYRGAATQNQVVSIPFSPTVGSMYKIHYSATGLATSHFDLQGLPLYPTTNSTGVPIVYLGNGADVVGLGLGTNVNSLKLIFDQASPNVDVKITKIEYLGGN